MSEIPKASIYTKKGDRGTTSLVDGSMIPKNDPRVEAYGDLDELNSVIGLLAQSLQNLKAATSLNEPSLNSPTPVSETLKRIQNHLFNAGSLLACSDENLISKLPQVTPSHVAWIESEIDSLNVELPKLNEFILPGGHEAAAWAHLARTVCRRAERHMTHLHDQSSTYSICFIYLNRLSDFFFTLARWIHLKSGTPEIKWDAKA